MHAFAPVDSSLLGSGTSALALLLGAPALLGEPAFPGSRRRPRGDPSAPHDQRFADESRQPLLRGAAVAKLTPVRIRNNAQAPACIETRGKARLDELSLCLGECGAFPHAPGQLDPCSGCVHVLPAGTAGSGRPET